MKTIYPTIQCLIPDFDFESEIQGYNKKWREKYIWIMHSILWQQTVISKRDYDKFTPLRSTILRKVAGERYYSYVLNQLTTSKVVQQYIDLNNPKGYRPNVTSKQYRIHPELLARITRIKSVPITKQTYCRKIALLRDADVKDAIKANDNLRHEHLMGTHRMIDVERAEHYTRQNYEQGSKPFQARIHAIREMNNWQHAKFENGVYKHDFHFSYKGGRLYSPATSLPRDLEQFTYFRGFEDEPSVCMDMQNSQLCFFNELVKRSSDEINRKKSQHIDSNHKEEISNENQTPLKGSKLPPSILPHNTPSYVLTISPTWEDVIFSGKGYERMMHLCKWKDKESAWTKDERQEFKAEFFGQLFYNAHLPKLTYLEEIFLAHYPIEAEGLRYMKKLSGNKPKVRFNANTGKFQRTIGGSLLAVKVQELEGRFFHYVVASYMRQKHRAVPFTIKHDSITMPQSCAAYIAPEIDALASEFFGRAVELKKEFL